MFVRTGVAPTTSPPSRETRYSGRPRTHAPPLGAGPRTEPGAQPEYFSLTGRTMQLTSLSGIRAGQRYAEDRYSADLETRRPNRDTSMVILGWAIPQVREGLEAAREWRAQGPAMIHRRQYATSV